MIRYLRHQARDKIFERLNALQNGEALPDDILSNILKSYSTFKIKIKFYKIACFLIS